jgi:hypothetical protein
MVQTAVDQLIQNWIFSFNYSALKMGPKFFFQRGAMSNTGNYLNIKIIANVVVHDVLYELYQDHL